MSDEKKKKGRPCKMSYTKFNQKTKTPIQIETEAHFHCWASRPTKNDDKSFNSRITETVGICELPDGWIRLVRPEKIQFTDVAVASV